MNEKLKVKIPERFKEGLEKRFDLRRARKDWGASGYWGSIIPVECVLCANFRRDKICELPGLSICTDCPFSRFGDKSITSGCVVWIKMVLGEELLFEVSIDKVLWEKTSNKKARRQIKKLKNLAKGLIEWV